jgi:Fe-S oxidoreductase
MPALLQYFQERIPTWAGVEVVHYVQLLESFVQEGRLSLNGSKKDGMRITYHDPCYLGGQRGLRRTT